MILPIVLDTCTVINLLRIDEDDEFLFKKIKKLNVNISGYVYSEAQRNVSRKPFAEKQKAYIMQQLPSLANIINLEDKIKNDYFDELKSFCNYSKENGELHSTLLSLYLCRKEGSRLFFYTDDFPAKKQFAPYFSFQQIGTIGDSVDLLLFLYWTVSDFQMKQLHKYLQNLYSEYATPLKNFFNRVSKKKDSWLDANRRDSKLAENLSKIMKGCNDLNFVIINEAIDFFKSNKSKYTEIYNIIEEYPDIDTETEITVKIRDIRSKLENYKICKRLC